MSKRLITTLLLTGMMCWTTRALWSQQPQADPFGPAPAADPFGPAPEQPTIDPFDNGTNGFFKPVPSPTLFTFDDPFGSNSESVTDFAKRGISAISFYSADVIAPPLYAQGLRKLSLEIVMHAVWEHHASKPMNNGLEVVGNDLDAAAIKKMTPAELLAHQLERPIKFSLNQNKLADLAETLRTKLKINVFIDKKAMEEAAFDTATPIDWFAAHPIKLRLALRMLLTDLGLTYVTDDGALVITTRTAAENRLIVRSYPVDSELLKVRKRLQPRSWGQFGGYGYGSGISSGFFNLKQGGLGAWGSGAGFGGGGPPLHAEYVELDSLVNLLTSMIQPTTWKTNGGLGDIAPNLQLGLLVVSNTEQVHDELAELLDVFKAKLAERKPPPVSPDAVERGIHTVVLPAVRLKQQNPLDHDRPNSREPAFTMEQLVAQIKQQIEPASWQNPNHKITTLGQNLIIEQTRANHAKIASFLKQLGITKEQVDDEKQFAEEQRQAREDLLLRQAQERERIEKEQIKQAEEQERKNKERIAAEEKEKQKRQEEKK